MSSEIQTNGAIHAETDALEQLSSYRFELPEDLIAKHPLAQRSDSRMLVIDPRSGRMLDGSVRDLPSYLAPQDTLFFNDTRVLRARLFGRKLSGGAIEILIERVIDSRTVLAQMGVSKKPRPNQEILLEDGTRVVVSERRGLFWMLKLMGAVLWPEVMDKIGHIPLPPYLQRADDQADADRYQTVYSNGEQPERGSVAAPTAGLHFDQALLAAIDAAGASREHLTLQVGAGTFAPIRAASLLEHRMHTERFAVPTSALHALKTANRRIAVGTTSLRSLESVPNAVDSDREWSAETQIFIRPGYQFRHCEGLLTNFHLPESSLLILVCAFMGHGLTMRAYQHAIAQHYRFYSYGDCMLILPGALPAL